MKKRLVEIVTIIAAIAFVVFMVRNCRNSLAITAVSASIEEPNDTDIENARKLGDNLINYADYAQGKIDEDEYVRRGTKEPNEPNTLVDITCEFSGITDSTAVSASIEEPNEPEMRYVCGDCAESFGDDEYGIYSHVCKGYSTSRLIHQIEAIESRLKALEGRLQLKITDGNDIYQGGYVFGLPNNKCLVVEGKQE